MRTTGRYSRLPQNIKQDSWSNLNQEVSRGYRSASLYMSGKLSRFLNFKFLEIEKIRTTGTQYGYGFKSRAERFHPAHTA